MVPCMKTARSACKASKVNEMNDEHDAEEQKPRVKVSAGIRAGFGFDRNLN